MKERNRTLPIRTPNPACKDDIRKTGKTTYAAPAQAGHPRVIGIQAEFGNTHIFPHEKLYIHEAGRHSNTHLHLGVGGTE